MRKLQLDRPIAFFDIESTGTSPRADRIVELCVIKLFPDGRKETYTWRINPQIPIPAEATNIHGISDTDVASAPTFAELADRIEEVFADSDLGGYNLIRFDVPMLVEEFARTGRKFDPDSRRILDAQRIFHQREPRDLSAAMRFYCDEELVGAHGAEADVDATIKVLEGQLVKYDDLPLDVDALDAYCNPRDPSWVDRQGRLMWQNGEVVLNFGRKKGMRLRDLAEQDKNFCQWILRSDFPQDTRVIVQNALDGKLPTPPSAS
jgi:DNA polymerase-3 subunit epsilon